jgi:hypothetical protein
MLFIKALFFLSFIILWLILMLFFVQKRIENTNEKIKTRYGNLSKLQRLILTFEDGFLSRNIYYIYRNNDIILKIKKTNNIFHPYIIYTKTEKIFVLVHNKEIADIFKK